MAWEIQSAEPTGRGDIRVEVLFTHPTTAAEYTYRLSVGLAVKDASVQAVIKAAYEKWLQWGTLKGGAGSGAASYGAAATVAQRIVANVTESAKLAARGGVDVQIS